MSASLVGSEMCIRDSASPMRPHHPVLGQPTRKPGRRWARSPRPARARFPRSHAPGPPGARSRACLPAPHWG
eukprot:11216799-Alexandrium_andersonii.AAC.1